MPVGRPPKPTAIRILEGNRGHRPFNEAEPEPTKGFDEIPPGMPKLARMMWNRLVPELDRLDMLTTVDGAALESACRSYSQAVMADNEIDRIQRLIAKRKGDRGTAYELSMQNAVSKKAWNQYRSFATEFGLTPASRSRINLNILNPGSTSKSKKLSTIEAACG